MIQQNKNSTILVTGTNRGLGKHLALKLLQNLPNSQFIFTTRKSLQDFKHQCPQFFSKYKDRNFHIKQLDLNNYDSIRNFVKEIKNQNWKFDVIVNNAAMGFDMGDKVPDPIYTRNLLSSNVTGPIKLTTLLIDQLNQKARIINVSTEFGALKFHSKIHVQKFSNPKLTQQQIFDAIQQYIKLCEQGDLKNWFKSAYATSKMMLNAWSGCTLKSKLKNNQVSIAMSPGHCQTDMGGPTAKNSAQSGAQAIYDCIFMENPSFDLFYYRGKPYSYMQCGPGDDTAGMKVSSQ